MAVLDVASAISNVKTMVAGLSAWQTICGVATSTEAAERIYKNGVEEGEDCSLTPCIILRTAPLQTDYSGSHMRGQLTIELRVELEVPSNKQGTHEEQYVWVQEKCSALMAAIPAAVNGSGQLMMRGMNLPQDPGPIDPDENQGRCEWAFVIALVLDFI